MTSIGPHYIQNPHFPMRKSLINSLFTTCDSTIAPNKQRLEHNNLVIIWRGKLKGAHVVQEPLICKNLESKCKS